MTGSALDLRKPMLWLFLGALGTACLSLDESKRDAAQQNPAKPKNPTNSTDLSGDSDLPSLPFPKKATRHSTKLLLLAYPQPGLSKINSCIEQIKTQAEQSGSQEEMVLAKNILAEMLDHDRQVYHYCFFHMMAVLDQRLDEGGAVIETLAPIFLVTMRGLWILASSLDATEGDDRYFNFLKTRYVQLSQDYFGRPMETIGPPMGNLRFNPDQESSKPTVSPPPSEIPQKTADKKPLKNKKAKKAKK